MQTYDNSTTGHRQAWYQNDGGAVSTIDYPTVDLQAESDTPSDGDDFLFDDWEYWPFYVDDDEGIDADGNTILYAELGYGAKWDAEDGDLGDGSYSMDALLKGGNGNDLIVGGIGNDLLSGGEGNDELWGDVLTARVSYKANAQGVYEAVSHVVIDQHGEGNDILLGDAGDDQLYGGGGANILNGGAGDDQLVSRGQNDVLIGGDGADEFYIKHTANGAARILDFDAENDKVIIDNESPLADLYLLGQAFNFLVPMDWYATETDDGLTIALGDDAELLIDGAELPTDGSAWGGIVSDIHIWTDGGALL